jgi:hypothetical protein
MNNPSFSNLAYDNKKKKTRRGKSLEEINKVIPWNDIKKIVGPFYRANLIPFTNFSSH